ncbi:TonB-linked SusC/RagA family outer membrane protein [Mangrovibacterium diazotrophicum]|uniref:TonB-linked SusC/RagA family outer membrane protein n=2 Tax=Mangrovibacterium diazotrophicum TaxID=1261403 RepID=A0A419WA98_9BACT|nr:TonB-linked SusC/RagA family outer membrane protein [Mangrovibacterium diazotrophicum]
MKKNQIYPPDWQGYFVPKLFLCMKLTIFLFFLSMLGATASSFSQQAKFNLQLKNTTIKDVLDELKSQSDYQFFYSNDDFDVSRRVDVDLNNASIENVLEQILGDMDVSYKIVDKSVIISKSDVVWSFDQQQQQIVSVSGTVSDATGQPLPGVTVVEKGTTNGTITDFDGNYILKNISGASTLIFSFVGMENIEMPLDGRSQIDVVMQEQTIGLEEVVAIGYGVQRKEEVTGSVSSVDAEQMKEIPAANVSQALQGRVSGVQMTQTSSKPGASMQIRIRGTRSLNASNDPLIVLDGIPFAGSINDISPSDIKTLEILKDASATAIYGSRGANGVIIITTNKGKMGQKATVTYDSYVGLKTLFSKYPMMGSSDFIKLREYAGLYSNGSDESDDVSTDWQDLLFKNSMVTSHDVGVSGGTETGNYSFGIGYYKDEALVPEQNYTRFSIRSSLDQRIGDHVKVGFSTNSNYSITNGSDFSLYNTLATTPITDPYNEDGSLKTRVNVAGIDDMYSYTREGIKSLGDAWVNKSLAFGSYNTIYGELAIPGVEGLKYRLNIGLNFRTTNDGDYTGEGVFNSSESAASVATIGNSLTTNWAVENLVTYDRVFNNKHNFNFVGLYSAEQTHYHSSVVSATGIPSDQFQFYNLGQATDEITIDPDQQGYYEAGLKSLMARAMYSYNGKYMLSLAVRSDWSSRLSPSNNNHTYPAVSAGWNIGEENFMGNLKAVDRLKLRVGYGQTSNQSVDPYSTLGLLSSSPYNYGSQYVTGYYVSELANDNLGWEYSETYNVGLDFGLANSRITGTMEYYIQKTKDILFDVSLPSTSGVESYTANIGRSQNKGFELSLNGVIMEDHNGWTWDAGINIYANRNKLTGLASGVERDESNWWFVGHPIDVVYDYKKIGIWNEGDANMSVLEPNGQAGDIKVEYTGDYNEDGTPTRQINTDDRQIIDLEPTFQGGFSTRVAYKNVDLSVVGDFKSGGKLISTLYSSNGYLNMLTGRRNNVDVDYWTESNTDAKYPKPGGTLAGDNPKYGSTLGYFDASYLKVRTITLGYNFSRDGWLKDAGINKLRLYFTVQNPFVLFSPYNKESGGDPETNSYGDENQAVSTSYAKRLLVIGTNSPSTRNFLFGINLTF